MKKLFRNLYKTSMAIFVLSIVSFSVFAGKPNFSGTWALNKSKSTLSAEYSFSPSKMTITQDDKSINIQRELNLQGSGMTVVEKMTLDGVECTNEGYQGSKKLSIATWAEDGSSLTVKNKIGGMEMTSTQVYSLDGDILKIESTYTSSYGDMKETWILDKE